MPITSATHPDAAAPEPTLRSAVAPPVVTPATGAATLRSLHEQKSAAQARLADHLSRNSPSYAACSQLMGIHGGSIARGARWRSAQSEQLERQVAEATANWEAAAATYGRDEIERAQGPLSTALPSMAPEALSNVWMLPPPLAASPALREPVARSPVPTLVVIPATPRLGDEPTDDASESSGSRGGGSSSDSEPDSVASTDSSQQGAGVAGRFGPEHQFGVAARTPAPVGEAFGRPGSMSAMRPRSPTTSGAAASELTRQRKLVRFAQSNDSDDSVDALAGRIRRAEALLCEQSLPFDLQEVVGGLAAYWTLPEVDSDFLRDVEPLTSTSRPPSPSGAGEAGWPLRAAVVRGKDTQGQTFVAIRFHDTATFKPGLILLHQQRTLPAHFKRTPAGLTSSAAASADCWRIFDRQGFAAHLFPHRPREWVLFAGREVGRLALTKESRGVLCELEILVKHGRCGPWTLGAAPGAPRLALSSWSPATGTSTLPSPPGSVVSSVQPTAPFGQGVSPVLMPMVPTTSAASTPLFATVAGPRYPIDLSALTRLSGVPTTERSSGPSSTDGASGRIPSPGIVAIPELASRLPRGVGDGTLSPLPQSDAGSAESPGLSGAVSGERAPSAHGTLRSDLFASTRAVASVWSSEEDSYFSSDDSASGTIGGGLGGSPARQRPKSPAGPRQAERGSLTDEDSVHELLAGDPSPLQAATTAINRGRPMTASPTVRWPRPPDPEGVPSDSDPDEASPPSSTTESAPSSHGGRSRALGHRGPTAARQAGPLPGRAAVTSPAAGSTAASRATAAGNPRPQRPPLVAPATSGVGPSAVRSPPGRGRDMRLQMPPSSSRPGAMRTAPAARSPMRSPATSPSAAATATANPFSGVRARRLAAPPDMQPVRTAAAVRRAPAAPRLARASSSDDALTTTPSFSGAQKASSAGRPPARRPSPSPGR